MLPQREKRRKNRRREKETEKDGKSALEQYNDEISDKKVTLNKLYETMMEAKLNGDEKITDLDYVDEIPEDWKFEYLEHPADVLIHSWGSSTAEALENSAICMHNMMTNISICDIDPEKTFTMEIKGDSILSLIYNFLDDFLAKFTCDGVICKEVNVLELDEENFRVVVEGKGEQFKLSKHPQGTEVKAITYSAMELSKNEETGVVDIYVVLDI